MLEYTGERVVPDQMFRDVQVFQEHLARYTWALKYAKGNRVLDAGCGTGYGTWLLGCVAKSSVGMDVDGNALAYAQSYYGYEEVETPDGRLEAVDPLTRATFERRDLNIGPMMGDPWHDRFDLIVAFEVIEHLTEPGNFAKRMAWWQAPGAELLVSMPSNPDMDKNPFHVWNPGIYHIEQLLSPYYTSLEFYPQRLMHINDKVSLRPGQEHTCDYVICHALRSGTK